MKQFFDRHDGLDRNTYCTALMYALCTLLETTNSTLDSSATSLLLYSPVERSYSPTQRSIPSKDATSYSPGIEPTAHQVQITYNKQMHTCTAYSPFHSCYVQSHYWQH